MSWFFYSLRRYNDFQGRSRRKEYWSFILYLLLLSIGASFVDSIFGFSPMNGSFYGPVTSLLFLFMFIPSLAVSVRRLHDIGKSGWWLLVGFLPVIGTIWLLIFFIREGMEVENEYGPDPKEQIL